MTREEAIQYAEKKLERAYYRLEMGYLNDGLRQIVSNEYEFLRQAISALRKQETVTERHQLNDPLTLDELREMDGEPVWIKLFDPDEEFWVLRNEWVDTRNPEPMILFHMRWYSHADYGKTWLAYRQKPEECTV